MNADENADEETAFGMAMFAAANIEYEFVNDGTVKMAVKMGAIAQNDVQKWSLNADTIFINEDYYQILKSDKGFILKGDGVDLNLEKID